MLKVFHFSTAQGPAISIGSSGARPNISAKLWKPFSARGDRQFFPFNPMYWRAEEIVVKTSYSSLRGPGFAVNTQHLRFSYRVKIIGRSDLSNH